MQRLCHARIHRPQPPPQGTLQGEHAPLPTHTQLSLVCTVHPLYALVCAAEVTEQGAALVVGAIVSEPHPPSPPPPDTHTARSHRHTWQQLGEGVGAIFNTLSGNARGCRPPKPLTPCPPRRRTHPQDGGPFGALASPAPKKRPSDDQNRLTTRREQEYVCVGGGGGPAPAQTAPPPPPGTTHATNRIQPASHATLGSGATAARIWSNRLRRMSWARARR